MKSYWTLQEEREENVPPAAAIPVAGADVPPNPVVEAPLPNPIAPDIGPLDLNIEIRNGPQIGGLLQLGNDENDIEDEDESDNEDFGGVADEGEIIEGDINQQAAEEPEIVENEDDIEDMFELAQAVVERARDRENGPDIPWAPIPNPPPPENNRNNPIPPPLNRDRPRVRGVENVDVEVHVNLEILGLRGPLFGVLSYCCWLFAFNVLCVVFGAVTPTVAKDFASYFVHKYSIYLFNLSLHFFPQWTESVIIQKFGSVVQVAWSNLQFLRPLLKPTTSGQIFRLTEIINITLGNLTVAICFYLLDLIIMLFRPLLRGHSSYLQFLVIHIPRVVDMMKVGILMTIRIFWLPCVIGSIVISCFNILTQVPFENLIVWGGDHIVGAIAICWGVGIAYMLSTTISILQLREILHPDWLSKFIRPQESQVDLLTSLLLDPPLVQLRRLLVSFLVYAALILIFVFMPIYLVRYGFGYTTPVKVYFWYISPDLQIFIEIALLHTYFLMVLEKKKDIIGHWEHRCLLYLTHKLGISRYILPYSMKVLDVSI